MLATAPAFYSGAVLIVYYAPPPTEVTALMKNIGLLVACLTQAGLLSAAEPMPAPADPAAAAPPVKYQSVFESYRSYREEPIADWRSLNDETAAVGGHVGIFRSPSGHASHGAATPAAGKPPAGGPAVAESARPVPAAPQAPAAAGHSH